MIYHSNSVQEMYKYKAIYAIDKVNFPKQAKILKFNLQSFQKYCFTIGRPKLST